MTEENPIHESDRPVVKPPSLIPGVTLLGLAAVLIVVVLIKPDMPQGLKVAIVVVALLLVLALLAYAFRLFLSIQRGGRK